MNQQPDRIRNTIGLRADEVVRRRVEAAKKALDAEFVAEDARRGEEDVRTVLSTPEGRRFVMMIVGRSHVFGSVFAGCRGRDDLVYQTGRREFGCEIYALVNRCAPGLMRQAFDERDAVMSERTRRKTDAVKRVEIEEGVAQRDAARDAEIDAISETQGDQT